MRCVACYRMRTAVTWAACVTRSWRRRRLVLFWCVRVSGVAVHVRHVQLQRTQAGSDGHSSARRTHRRLLRPARRWIFTRRHGKRTAGKWRTGHCNSVGKFCCCWLVGHFPVPRLQRFRLVWLSALGVGLHLQLRPCFHSYSQLWWAKNRFSALQCLVSFGVAFSASLSRQQFRPLRS